MEQLQLLAAIFLVLVTASANHSAKLGELFDVKQFLITNGILKVFHDDIKVKKCESPLLCWPGRCFVVDDHQFCSCPVGFTFHSGRCINVRNCERNSNCYPGQCSTKSGWISCLCPEGYYSERGMCKEFQWNCKRINCKPGKCLIEFNRETCLCPDGYTAKAGKCVEVEFTTPRQMSTIMLMIIVAIASVMVTTFFGVCICYYTHQRSLS